VPTTLSSREFNQDSGRAKRAAESGPVYITDRGHPAHVLLTFRDYQRLVGATPVLDLLGEPDGVADVELSIPMARDVARPATFE
jgi:hypothetical protein